MNCWWFQARESFPCLEQATGHFLSLSKLVDAECQVVNNDTGRVLKQFNPGIVLTSNTNCARIGS